MDDMQTTENQVSYVAPQTGLMKRLYVKSPAPTTSYVFTLRQNGGSTTITCTTTSTTPCTDTTHTAALAAGDTVDIMIQPAGGAATATDIMWVVEFDPSVN
jgi:hypothetical protein